MEWYCPPLLSQQVRGDEGKQCQILVIDDRPDNRAVLVDMLISLGVDLVEASDGQVDEARVVDYSEFFSYCH